MNTKNPTTRRRFLKSAALATAVSPAIIPSAALGKAGTVPPSERIGMGFIGMGNMGPVDMRAFLGDPRVQGLAVCDVYAARREKGFKQLDGHYARQRGKPGYKACKAYHDFRELLAREDIDAVQVTTPEHWHGIIAIMAARAGKDIYCEKPLTLTIGEGRAMVDAVRANGRVCQAGTQRRSSGTVRRACELVRSGRIGEVKSVDVYVNGGYPSNEILPGQEVFEGLDWNLFVGPAPFRPFNSKYVNNRGWIFYRDFGGGQGQTNWGSHIFDVAQWGLGMDDSGPVEITPPRGDQPLTYKYANGVVLRRLVGGPQAIFHGTEGTLNAERCRSDPAHIARSPLGPNDVHLYRSANHHRNFIDCVYSRRKPVADVETSYRSVSVCHLGNIARWLDRPLKWDPGKEQFVNDTEANAWLDRPKRAPWRV